MPNLYSQQFISASPSQYATCVIENGIIYQIVDFTSKQPIGVDNATIEESIALVKKYHDRLVELGDIILPKTQEQINEELLETIRSLKSEISGLRGGTRYKPKSNSETVENRSLNSKSSDKHE